MGDPIHNSPESRSPRDRRKRPHEHSDSDGRRRVRRRSGDEYGQGAPLHRRSRSRSRTRSPRRSEHLDRRDHRHDHDGGDTRDSRNGVGHRDEARHQRYNQGSPRPRSPIHHRTSHHSRDDTHSSHLYRHHHRSRRNSTPSRRDLAPALPCGARPLSRSADFDVFRPLFGRYLDIQKQIDIAAIDEREARGRWRSFVNKWNNGELAEGWYRPETFEDATLDFQEAGNGKRQDSIGGRRNSSTAHAKDIHTSGLKGYNAEVRPQDTEEDEEDNDDYGPTLPTLDDIDSATGTTESLSQAKHGPGIPTLSDLTLRRELEAADRDDARALLRHERKADRALQKERLDELVPRADPGSQARKLEKRREVRESNAAFAHAKSGGDAMPDIADAELMGDSGGGVEEYKRMKREAERRRTEREVRREEVLRAKREEREERQREFKEREAQTVEMLREIARERFG